MGPTQTVEKVYSLMAEGNCVEANELKFGEQLEARQCPGLAREFSRTEVEILSEEINGDEAFVVVKLSPSEERLASFMEELASSMEEPDEACEAAIESGVWKDGVWKDVIAACESLVRAPYNLLEYRLVLIDGAWLVDLLRPPRPPR